MSRPRLRRAQVRVPATSANLGAGFDCIGIAVDRWLTASVALADEGPRDRPPLVIHREGALAELDLPPQEDLVYTGFAAACAVCGVATPPHLAFSLRSDIPLSRGLGSSSAALVAGAALADVVLGLGLGRVGLAGICTGIEGHPDNVGPAIFGSAVMGVRHPAAGTPGGWVFRRLVVNPALAFAFGVPEFHVTTAEARAVLPASLPYATAASAAARSAALVQGLRTGDAALLAIALDDLLHVPFRRALVAGYDAVVDAALAAGAHGATLSGSGPAVVAVAPVRIAERVASAMCGPWRAGGIGADAFVHHPATVVRLTRERARQSRHEPS